MERKSMTKTKWKAAIEQATKEAGTYRPFFDSVISTLAVILERRDKLERQYKRDGSEALVEHTNKNGSVNMEQNPLLRLINDLNRDALTYWRDLGLTPAGLKKINENAMKEVKADALTEALRELGD